MDFQQELNGSTLKIIGLDMGAPVIEFFYYGETKSVGIKKLRQLTMKQRISIIFFLRKVVVELEEGAIAYCKVKDFQTNKLLKLIGFSFKKQKMNYNMYCNGSTSSSTSSSGSRH